MEAAGPGQSQGPQAVCPGCLLLRDMLPTIESPGAALVGEWFWETFCPILQVSFCSPLQLAENKEELANCSQTLYV